MAKLSELFAKVEQNVELSPEQDLAEALRTVASAIEAGQIFEEEADAIADFVDQLMESTDKHSELLENAGSQNEEALAEGWRWVVRKGKKVRKLQCPDGFRAKDGKCIKMSAAEQITRAKAAFRSRGKRAAKMSRAIMRRKKSMTKFANLYQTPKSPDQAIQDAS